MKGETTNPRPRCVAGEDKTYLCPLCGADLEFPVNVGERIPPHESKIHGVNCDAGGDPYNPTFLDFQFRFQKR